MASCLLWAGGCITVNPDDGVYACDPGHCPDGLACNDDHRCRRPSTLQQPTKPDLGVPPDGGSGPDAAFAFARYEDDFSQNDPHSPSGTSGTSAGWTGAKSAGWTTANPGLRDHWYAGDTTGDIQSYRSSFVLGSSWNLGTLVSFKALYQDDHTTGSASIVFSDSRTAPHISATLQLQRTSAGLLDVRVQWYDGESWHQVLDSGWLSGSSSDFYQVKVQRTSHDPDRLWISVSCTNGFSFSSWTDPLGTPFLDTVQIPGYRVSGALAWFTNLSIQTPALVWTDEQRHYYEIAHRGIDDLLTNWWVGDWKGGHIKPTFCGLSPAYGDERGQVWERAEMIFAIDGLYHANADINLKEILKSQWYYDKLTAHDMARGSYSAAEWASCGKDSATGPALDDATWKLRYLLVAYEATRDPDALTYARNLATAIFQRWSDGTYGGGLWYNDAHSEKNLVGAAFAAAALELYQLDVDNPHRDVWWSYAVNELTWIESTLTRTQPDAAHSGSCDPAGPPADGIYWMSYGPDVHNGNAVGLIGGECPGDWRPSYIENGGGSVSSFMGVTAMNVARSLQYQITADPTYLDAAVRGANAIATSRLVDGNGIYKNDRDAFADGTFSSMWARNVLTDSHHERTAGISESALTYLRNSADSIASKGRQTGVPFPAGSYRGDWSDTDVWATHKLEDCSKTLGRDVYITPDLLMVSASSVGMLVGASHLP